MESLDLFVIGAGSGGVRAARIASQLGAKVAICEEERVGGTCVLRGCVPKKLLVYASEGAKSAKLYQQFGWDMSVKGFSWPTLIGLKDKELDRLNKAYLKGLSSAGVTLIEGRGRLVGPNQVEVAGKTYEAKNILIAVGGWPMLPDVPGKEHAITSNEALSLKELPKKIAIVGGGFIAVEFAGIFAGFGSEVDIIYRRDKVLRGFDEDIRDRVTAEYKQKGINIRSDEDVEAVEANGLVKLRSGETIQVDKLMYATGRLPNTKNLGLEEVGVEVGRKGEIIVDEYSRSNIPSVYAVGDVTDRINLTPVAIREGHAVARNLFEGTDIKVSHDLVPSAVFSQPPVGTVGLTEEEARKKFDQIKVYKTDFRPMKYSLSDFTERVLYKLIVEGDAERVVGCHLVGLDSAEIIQTAAIAIKMGASKPDFDNTVAVHPTSAEELVTLR